MAATLYFRPEYMNWQCMSVCLFFVLFITLGLLSGCPIFRTLNSFQFDVMQPSAGMLPFWKSYTNPLPEIHGSSPTRAVETILNTMHGCVSIHQTRGGGTQILVGYGCPARSFNHHPITKPERTKICNLCLNHMFLEGSFFKPISRVNRGKNAHGVITPA